jgi:hypothetical protein
LDTSLIQKMERTRVLVPNPPELPLLYFTAGVHGVYIHRIVKTYPSNCERVQQPNPVILTVSYLTKTGLNSFLYDTRSYKVFKCSKPIIFYDGFIKNTVKNALALRPRSVFRFDCKKHRDIEEQFYQTAELINAQEPFHCKFDYQTYDYKLSIRVYTTLGNRKTFVSILTGPDMPNGWQSHLP